MTRSFWLAMLLAGLLLITSCAPSTPPAPTETPVPTSTATPDPCAVDAEADWVNQMDALLQEFNDTTYVANMTPQAQLGEMILRLQDNRRRMANLDTPLCVQSLQSLGVNYMNAVITYLGLFMSGSDRDQIASTISASQSLREYYENEHDRILSSAGLVQAPTAVNVTPAVITPEGAMVSNDQNQTLNLRSFPALDAPVAGYFLPNETLPALGRTEDGTWILVQSGDQQLWVYANVVTLNSQPELLPVTMPTVTPTRTSTAASPLTEAATATPQP